MKKKYLVLAMVLLMSFALAACSGASNTAATNNNAAADAGDATEGTTLPDNAMKVGFVTDEGGINDRSFNQGVWEGLEQAKKDFQADVSYQESHNADDYSPNVETLVDAGNGTIVAAGFKLADAIREKAEAYPDVNFAIVDFSYDEPLDNLTGILFKAEQPSFLVGYIAGLTTESNKVGFVGGQESPVIDGFDYGFQAGVQYAAKELGKTIEVQRQYVGGFSDVAKGKAIAMSMYSNGCDVVFHAAGAAGDGVIDAAKDAGKWVIGVDRDQYDAAPEVVLTSAMKRADVAVHSIVQQMKENGTFPGGQTLVFGLENDGAVDIAPTSDKNVKPEILEKIPALKEKIIAGEIAVPNDKATFDTFMSSL